MGNTLWFWLNNRRIEVGDLPGTTTLLRYLRDHAHMPGTKEGCAEGDCGACTVAVLDEGAHGPTWRAVNSCLLFLPMLQGKRVVTVEGLRDVERTASAAEGYHPAQRAMVEARGSQCGYCTPGIVMSLFEAAYRTDLTEDWQVDDQLCGNLCRCTGYRPIRQAGHAVAGCRPQDQFQAELNSFRPTSHAVVHEGGGQHYIQPGSLPELWEARRQYPAAPLVAGGTDLGLAVTKKHAEWPVVIGLEGLSELRTFETLATGWRVGAGMTLTEIMERIPVPALDKHLRVFGSRQIRSRATLGGNLCTASPIGDLAPLLLAWDAIAILAGPSGERRVPLDSFFQSYRVTALAEDEILLAIELPQVRGSLDAYKVSKRREMDISTVAAGMRVVVDAGRVAEIRLAYGGMAATPKRATATEQALLGGPWNEPAVVAATTQLAADFAPIDDHRGSARYRATVARNLLLGFYHESNTAHEPPVARPVGTAGRVR